jgi:hypothetical protein
LEAARTQSPVRGRPPTPPSRRVRRSKRRRGALLSKEIIDVTPVVIVSAGMVGDKTRLVGRSHVVSIDQGGKNTAVITLSTGEEFNVRETCEEMKRILKT